MAMIWYFWKSLRSSISATIKQRNWELDNFEELIKKVENTETKTTLQPYTYARDINQYCLRRSQPETEKAKSGLWKDSKNEKPKSQN